MNCAGAPRVVPPAQQDAVADDVQVGTAAERIPIWAFEYKADGTFSVRVPDRVKVTEVEAIKRGAARAQAIKKGLFKEGLMSFSDAMYIAARLLAERLEIAEVIAQRFDEIVVDEVQDTTDLQFACIEALKNAGLKSIVMVGDPDQAIYGWDGSTTPQSAAAFAAKLGMHDLHLTTNYRSSQLICELAAKFSSRTTPDHAGGPDQGASNAPELFLYEPAAPIRAVTLFAARLNQLGIDPGESAILARTGAFVRHLNGVSTPDTLRSVEVLGLAKAELEALGSLEFGTIQQLEALLAEFVWGRAALQLRTPSERLALRDQTLILLTKLPALAGNLADWIDGARTATAGVLATLTSSPTVKPGNRIKSKNKKRDAGIQVNVAFRKVPPTMQARTVHSAKGESHQATLLIADRPHAPRNQAREWIDHQSGAPRNQESNVAYVGLTRARKYVALALPKTTPVDLVGKYKTSGFALYEPAPGTL